MNKMTPHQLDDMSKFVASTKHENPELRYGQYTFIVLFERHKKIAIEIAGTEYDPFYCDDLLSAFYKHMEEKYVQQPPTKVELTEGALACWFIAVGVIGIILGALFI